MTKELMAVSAALIAAYLILTHATGFSRSVAAIGSGYTGAVKALQGR
jgi:hypothetical protein